RHEFVANAEEKGEPQQIPHVNFFRGDVSVSADVKNFVRYVIEKEKKIDFIVNNAATFHTRPLEEESDESFTDIVDVNLRGYFLLAREAIPYLKKQKKGTIVNIASTSAYVVAERFSTLYCMTKGGIVSFTKALAEELADFGVRVLSVSPAGVATAMEV